MLEIAITFLLAGHLWAMNVASLGPVVGAWLVGWRRSEGGQALGRRVIRLSLAGLAIGSMLGGGLLLLPNPPLQAALGRFPASTYWFAGLELLFSAACIGILATGAWAVRRRFLAWGVALLASSNLLYHFPPLMAVIGELAADPRWTAVEVIQRRALLRLWLRPEVLSLWAHFVLASITVAAVVALRPWRRGGNSAGDLAPDAAILRRLGGVALAATALQLPVGVWVVMSTSDAARESIMGGNLAGSLCFAGGVLAALWLLQTLLTIALGEDDGAVRRAGWLLVIITVLMSATLRASRQAASPSVQQKAASSASSSANEAASRTASLKAAIKA